MEEVWRDVVGYEGRYEVSSLGNVRSLLTFHFKKGRKVLKAGTSTSGYKIVVLSKDRKYTPKTIHRLVMNAFVPNVNNLPEVNHINGIKTDNRLVNLEWCTSGENKIHAIKTGLRKGRADGTIGSRPKIKVGRKKGADHHRSKVVLQLKDGAEVAKYGSVKIASEIVGVCHQAIANACREPFKRVRGFQFQYA